MDNHILETAIKDQLLESFQKDQLYTALAQAQAEFPIIRNNRKAFKNEYADLYAILKDVYPVLSKYGLSIRPWSGSIHGEQWIGARLMHKSGQFETNIYKLEIENCKPHEQFMHKKQSTLTYFKRNHIKDMLCVLISDDLEDDDGQPNDMYKTNTYSKNNIHHDEEYIPVQWITKDQLDQITATLINYPSIKEKLLKAYNIDFLYMLPKQDFMKILEGIQQRKNLLNETKKEE